MLNVKVWASGDPHQLLEFRDVDYLSFINHDTYGKPPLVVGEDERPALAREDDRVVYVNTALAAVVEVEKLQT